jgi:hypothetical protein
LSKRFGPSKDFLYQPPALSSQLLALSTSIQLLPAIYKGALAALWPNLYI